MNIIICNSFWWWWFSHQAVSDFCNLMGCSLPGSSVHGILQAKNTGVGCHFILQGIFLTQGLNLGLLNCRQILYQMSHQGSPGEALKSHTIDEIRISFIWFDSGVEVLNHPTTCFNVCLLLCLPQVPLAVCWSLWTPSQNLFLCVHKIQRITKNKRHLQWNTLISLLEKQIYDMVV